MIPDRSPTDRPSDRPDEGGLARPETGGNSPVTGDDSSRLATDPPRNNHAGSIGLTRLMKMTSERDRQTLRTVHRHRLVSTRHLYEFHFWNHASEVSGIRACTRVLGRLESLRLIRRVSRPMGGHGGGSSSTIWALDVAGDRLSRHLEGRPGRSHTFEPSHQFQAHTLAVADAHVALLRGERAGLYELLEVASEPDTWRRFPSGGAVVTLKPDLAAITASPDYEDHWLIEIDLGTEGTTALLRKCQTYQRYRASGREEAAHGVFPRVLWLMPNQERADKLRSHIAARTDLEDALFTVITNEQLIATVADAAATANHASGSSHLPDRDPQRGTQLNKGVMQG